MPFKQVISPFHVALFGLVVLGVGLLTYLLLPEVDAQLKSLIVTAGVAIILGAFGGAATVQYQGWAITGVAGITFVFLFFFNQSVEPVSYFEISSDQDMTGLNVSVTGDEKYYGVQGKTYKFLVPDKQGKHQFDVEIGDERILNLPMSRINKHLGKGIETEWVFESDPNTGEPKLYELQAEGRFELRSAPSKRAFASAPSVNFDISLIPEAHAGDHNGYSFEQLVDELESENTLIRRRARLELAKMGMARADDLLDILGQSGNSYRLDLGVLHSLVILAEGGASELRSRLSEDHFYRLGELLQHPDGTMRRDAQAFLISLGGPRSASVALEVVRSSQDPKVSNGAFRVFSRSYLQLSDADRQQYIIELPNLLENESLDESLISAIQSYQDQSVESLSGTYSGQWGSDKFTNYGKIDVKLKVQSDGSALADFTATGGTIKWGELMGKIRPVAPGVWEAELGYQKFAHGTEVVARISAGKMQGDYEANFRFIFKDFGWWALEKVGSLN